MIIRAGDYLRDYENEKLEIHAAIEKVLNSGRLILGESVKNFEEAFSSYCDVRFGVGVNSGTDVLFIGLMALGIGEVDEVITVSNTAVPTVSSIAATGAVPRFIDIDSETYFYDGHLPSGGCDHGKAPLCTVGTSVRSVRSGTWPQHTD